MTAAKLKLTYLNLKGRAEVIRLILVAASKEYEDQRITWEEWPEFKPYMPLGQIPVMEINEKKFPQSVALANHFAREFGFYGKTNMDKLRIDVIAQLAQDFIQQWGRGYYSKDENYKNEQIHKVKSELAPMFLGYIESMLKETGTGWMVGDSLSMADMIVYDILTGGLKGMVEHIDIATDYPLLQAHKDHFENLDKIKDYLASRPDTPL